MKRSRRAGNPDDSPRYLRPATDVPAGEKYSGKRDGDLQGAAPKAWGNLLLHAVSGDCDEPWERVYRLDEGRRGPGNRKFSMCIYNFNVAFRISTNPSDAAKHIFMPGTYNKR